MIRTLVENHYHVLAVGNTGTSKSVVASNYLLQNSAEHIMPVIMSFSARTSANQTQDIIDGKCDKRRKGVYGPPAGREFVIFVDDTNMPAREEYGAQPPVELLRQWADHGGWYDRKALQFRRIVSTTLLCAVGPPGGGRNPMTERFTRHFTNLTFTDMSDESLFGIFHTIMDAFVRRNLVADLTDVASPIVKGTVAMFSKIKATLLPTPTKSHYTFNLRDLSKVFQGVCMADPKSLPDLPAVLKLWAHEATRVFNDRLINDEDRGTFRGILSDTLEEHFDGQTMDTLVGDRRLIFGDFMNPGADPKLYSEIEDLVKLKAVVEEYLEDYCQSFMPMKLVMFLNAIEHVARISRVIRQPQGNALLLGVGGSGRQSLTRLAAFMAEYQLFQIEISKSYDNNAWREDIKRLMTTAGLENQPIVFLFTDTQIVHEGFLEDINNLLNSGEVPNLFEQQDLDTIYVTMRPICQGEGLPLTKVSLFQRFVGRVRDNIHVVLAMSPVGEQFRSRLRMMPALTNNCTINWFAEWPEEALRSVALDAVRELDLGSDATRNLVVEMCVTIHQTVERFSYMYKAELRRTNHVTPTSYLELLNTICSLMSSKREELAQQKRRLEIGLQKLAHTANEVATMQDELTELQPVLIETGHKVESMMVQITKDKVVADETRKVALEEETAASAKAEECQAIKDDAEKDLAEALPALELAVQSLKHLTIADIREVANYNNPPFGVKLVMEAICIMFDQKPKKADDPNNVGKKIDDFWVPSKKMLADPKGLLESLFKFDKDNIPEKRIKRIVPYVNNPEFTPDKIKRVSTACTSMCMWAHAMYKYHTVAKEVAPKRARLAAAEEELGVVTASLAKTKAALAEVEAKIKALEETYQENVDKKEELANKVQDTEVKLDRANRLIGGLGGERIRWEKTVEELSAADVNLIGDMLIASGGVAYFGAFTADFRHRMTAAWHDEMSKLAIPFTKGVTALTVLTDPVKLRTWLTFGLPGDSHSAENSTIMATARRWPFFIDPQGQANKWIKLLEKDQSIDVIKLSDKDYLRTLENDIRFGRPCLIENVPEELDPALEPVLLQQTFKQGGALCIKLGDSTIPYHPDFKLYITSKLPSPNLSPELSVKVTLLNFGITNDGLEDQLLGLVVQKERPDLEEMKAQLVASNARMKNELQAVQDRILELLSQSEGNILDDEVLIDTLGKSKETSAEITIKVAEAEETERDIDQTREEYRPVAERSSVLYFAVDDLANIDPMYQYSLQWFVGLFTVSIEAAPQSSDIATRLAALDATFLYNLYRNVCRSLFEDHKLLFSLLLTVRLQVFTKELDFAHYQFLIAGPIISDPTHPKPTDPTLGWILDPMWLQVCGLQEFPAFAGIVDSFNDHPADWLAYYDSETPHTETLPAPFADANLFARLMVLRSLRPDKVVDACVDYVVATLGQKFVEPPTFNLGAIFEDSTSYTPLIFVLSAGADPASELHRFAEEMHMSRKMVSISLGQGQGPRAEKMIADGQERGLWILLANVHLAVSWMPSLERIVEQMAADPSKINKDFRLWLTSMPSPKFPVPVLQDSVKITNEAPKGLRSNLLRTWTGYDDRFLEESSTRPMEFKKILYGLTFFHAIIQERRRFGPLGCFPEDDHELLTEHGWMTLAQVEEYLEEHGETHTTCSLRFASYNEGTGEVVFDAPRSLVVNPHMPDQPMVELGTVESRARWTGPASEVSTDDVSLVTTPNHDLYVKLGHKQDDTVHWSTLEPSDDQPRPSTRAKVQAQALLDNSRAPARGCPHVAGLLARTDASGPTPAFGETSIELTEDTITQTTFTGRTWCVHSNLGFVVVRRVQRDGCGALVRASRPTIQGNSNITYEYTTGDLVVCMKQLIMILDKYDDIPYNVIRFLAAEINYGGSVTDDWDRRTVNTVIDVFINSQVQTDEYSFSVSGTYKSPPVGDQAHYLTTIRGLPLNPQPEVFGMHANADITSAQQETQILFDDLISLQPQASGAAGRTREDVLDEMAADLIARLPPRFDVAGVSARYPTVYEESMNTVLTQECVRYNKLTTVIAASLPALRQALRGVVVMSQELEGVADALFGNRVPTSWEAVAYPSLKPLSSWFNDLLHRLTFVRKWVDDGIPPAFWISGFFFPQAFLTGTLQNFARKHLVSVDSVSFETVVVDHMDPETVDKRPDDGCLIHGLFLEGARWDSTEHRLADSRPKELFVEVPMIHLRPVSERVVPETGVYLSPVYKTLTRAGTLSTTGHSTNYVLALEMPTNEPAKKWVMRGTAMVCALKF